MIIKLVILKDSIFLSENNEKSVKWNEDNDLTLEETGFMYKISTSEKAIMDQTDFNCTDNRYICIVKNLEKKGYSCRIKSVAVMSYNKGVTFSDKVLEHLSSLGYDRDSLTNKKITRIKYDDGFNDFFSIYPKRIGLNSKPEAYKQWKLRLEEGYTPAQMIIAATNYQIFCDKSGNIDTEYVRAAKNFIGKDKIFLEEINFKKNKKEKYNVARFIPDFEESFE